MRRFATILRGGSESLSSNRRRPDVQSRTLEQRVVAPAKPTTPPSDFPRTTPAPANIRALAKATTGSHARASNTPSWRADHPRSLSDHAIGPFWRFGFPLDNRPKLQQLHLFRCISSTTLIKKEVKVKRYLLLSASVLAIAACAAPAPPPPPMAEAPVAGSLPARRPTTMGPILVVSPRT